MTRIYRYILDFDGGMAPCPQDGIVSLGTCKPGIRHAADPGDWVAGFMPGTSHLGELVWAGQVTDTLSHGDYRERFRHRRDAVYGLGKSGRYEPLLRGYHCDPQQQERDWRHPVLVFDRSRSRYLGGEPVQLPDDLMHLAPEGRPWRVNFRRDGDLAAWEEFVSALPSSHGVPRDEFTLCGGCVHCSGSPYPGNGCGKGSPSNRKPPKGSC